MGGGGVNNIVKKGYDYGHVLEHSSLIIHYLPLFLLILIFESSGVRATLASIHRTASIEQRRVRSSIGRTISVF